MLDALSAILDARDIVTTSPDIDPYLEDALGEFHQPAIAAVKPRNAGQVAAVVRLCAEQGIAIATRGGGSGFNGAATPTPDARQIVLSLERMNTIREVDIDNDVIIAEAGVVLAHVQKAADDANRLFPVSFGGEGTAHIGGIIGTNAGGNNVVRYGMTRAQILGLEVVLPDGTIWDGLKVLRKDNTGYDLKQLFIGAEGTLGIVTAAALALRPKPRVRATAIAAVPDVATALTTFRRLREEVGELIGAFELIPRSGFEAIRAHKGELNAPFAELPEWATLIELEASAKSLDLTTLLEEALSAIWEDVGLEDAVIAQSEGQRQAFWALREGLGEALSVSPKTLKSDTSVPLKAIPEFVEKTTEKVMAVLPDAIPIPFGHMGDGNIHYNVAVPDSIDLETFRQHKDALADAVHSTAVSLGGSVSAEHGLGQLKRDLAAAAMSDAELDLMHKIKDAIDPQGIMNPDKVIKSR